MSEGVVTGEGYQVETPVHSVVDANHSDVAHNLLGEEQFLPRSTEMLRVVYHRRPLLVVQVQGYLDDVRIGSEKHHHERKC